MGFRKKIKNPGKFSAKGKMLQIQRYFPVMLSFAEAISSGVPAATIPLA